MPQSVEAPRREPVTVSLASIPPRAAQLRQVVERLLPQVDRLNVYLNGHSEIPGFLRHPKLSVARSQDHGDRGDAGKFFWADTLSGYHLTCDDDIDYPVDYVAHLVRDIDALGRRAVVSYHGARLREGFSSYYRVGDREVFHYRDALADWVAVHLGGTGVMGYHSSTLRVRARDFHEPNMADTWLGLLAQQQKVPIVTPPRAALWLRDLETADSIFTQGLGGQGSAEIQDRMIQAHMPWRLFPVPAYREADFWEDRYQSGGNSGAGSRGEEADWKIARIAERVASHGVRSILDLGSGDGYVARRLMERLPPDVSYLGIDIAPSAVNLAASQALSNMRFEVADFTGGFQGSADLVLCMDVLFHLSTPEKQQAAIDAICRSFRKLAVVAAWNEGIVEEYRGRFAAHTFYRPFQVPDGISAEGTPIPACPSKTLYVLRQRKSIRPSAIELYAATYLASSRGRATARGPTNA
jgi:SAM-dependent methyltransferase